MRPISLVIAVVALVVACSSQPSGLPNGWANQSFQGIHWSMPANPEVKTFPGGPKAAGDGQSYGHNAIRADGTLDPLASFNVFVLPLIERPTATELASMFTEWGERNGLGVSGVSALSSPLVGQQAAFHEPTYNVDGVVRSSLYGNVLVIALHGGNVGTDGRFFLDSFGLD